MGTSDNALNIYTLKFGFLQNKEKPVFKEWSLVTTPLSSSVEQVNEVAFEDNLVLLSSKSLFLFNMEKGQIVQKKLFKHKFSEVRVLENPLERQARIFLFNNSRIKVLDERLHQVYCVDLPAQILELDGIHFWLGYLSTKIILKVREQEGESIHELALSKN